MSFPRYQEYKKCASKLLDEIPSNWSYSRVRYLTSIQKGRLPSKTFSAAVSSTDLAYLSMEYLRSDKEAVSSTFVTDDESNIKADDGDILVLWDGSNAGEFLRAKRGVVSSTLARIKPININRDYLFFALKSLERLLKEQSIGMGIPHVSSEVLRDLCVFIPPKEDQPRLVHFLNQEIEKINDLTNEQEKLIELLKEKRQSIISSVTTKGLDPKAEMKPSGIDWLGQIPKKWSIKRLKHISPFLTVGIVVNPSSFVSDEGLPFIYGGDIRDGVIDWENSRKISSEASLLNSKTILSEGDLLTVRVGAPGITAVVPKECEGGNCASVMFIRKGKFNSHWLCYVMNTRTVRFQVEVVQYGAAQEQFNISHAVDFWVPVPPLEEQDAMTDFLNSNTSKIDTLIEEAKKAITLLQERRSELISAVVTGQIDVRNVADAMEIA